MHRVVVLGTSGAGKTTISRELAQLHGLPCVDLDDLAAGPVGGKVPAEVLRERVAAVLDQPSWVIDGDYERGRSPGGWSGDTKLGDMVLEHADTAVWLDLPLRVSLARMWTRTSGRSRNQVEPQHETWSLDHLRWAQWEVRSHLRRRLKMRDRLGRHHHLTVVHLRSQREVDAWVARQSSASAVEPLAPDSQT